MPKKVKKVSKSKKISRKVISKPLATKKVSLLKKYALPILVVATVILGALLYKNLLVSPEINMVTDGSTGGGGGKKATQEVTCTTKLKKAGYTVYKNKCRSKCEITCMTNPDSKECIRCEAREGENTVGLGGSKVGAPQPIGIPVSCEGLGDDYNKCCAKHGYGSRGYGKDMGDNYSGYRRTTQIYAWFSGSSITGIRHRIYCYESVADVQAQLPNPCKNFGTLYYQKSDPMNKLIGDDKYQGIGDAICVNKGACNSIYNNTKIFHKTSLGAYEEINVRTTSCSLAGTNSSVQGNIAVTSDNQCCPPN